MSLRAKKDALDTFSFTQILPPPLVILLSPPTQTMTETAPCTPTTQAGSTTSDSPPSFDGSLPRTGLAKDIGTTKAGAEDDIPKKVVIEAMEQ